MNNTIIFPDGEMLTIAQDRIDSYFRVGGTITYLPQGLYPSQITPPFASQQTIDAFVMVNFVMRPPLTDEEIRLMPVDELIGTYYNLRQYKGELCQFVPHPVLSAGLPDMLAYQHETTLQRRMFALRGDLWSITYQGQTYRILLDPHLLDQPECHGIVAGIAQAIVVGIFSLGLGALGAVASVAVNAAQAGASVAQAASAAKTQAHATGVAGEIQNGISLARQLVHDPSPDAATVNSLKTKYYNWQQQIKWANLNARQVNLQWVHIQDPAVMLAGNKAINNYHPLSVDGSNYVARWQPYPKFFWSDRVAAMLSPGGAPTISPTVQTLTQNAGPIAIGAGLLLLLL